MSPTPLRFRAHTDELLGLARGLSAAELAELMDLSEDLAALNHGRFRVFGEGEPRPAILAFAGDVYLGLDAPSLSVDDLSWAQDRLAILSGLYGLLRPLDGIWPYRLEMGTSLANARGRNLVAFWKGVLAPAIDEAVAGHSSPVVLNLASDEYFSAVERGGLKARVVTPVFQDVKDGKARAVFLFVKKARGAAARWLVQNRVEDPDALRAAVIDGYRFVPEASDDARWVFRRPQPPSRQEGNAPLDIPRPMGASTPD